MKLAIKKAKEIGVGCVGVHNSNHFGVTGFYSDLAIRDGVIGLVIANTEPAIAPLGASLVFHQILTSLLIWQLLLLHVENY